MKICYTVFSTVFLGCISLSEERRTECNIICEPGYRCVLQVSTCDYPPCPYFPTCVPISGHVDERSGSGINHVQRHEGHRRHHRRHHRRSHSQSSFQTQPTDNGAQLSPRPISRPGQCPPPTVFGPCIQTCRSDLDCPTDEKCCTTGCGHTCRPIMTEAASRPGTCPGLLTSVSLNCQRECEADHDCSAHRKCCNTACGTTCSDPCFYWIRPNQRSTRNRKSVMSNLPFLCRN